MENNRKSLHDGMVELRASLEDILSRAAEIDKIDCMGDIKHHDCEACKHLYGGNACCPKSYCDELRSAIGAMYAAYGPVYKISECCDKYGPDGVTTHVRYRDSNGV